MLRNQEHTQLLDRALAQSIRDWSSRPDSDEKRRVLDQLRSTSDLWDTAEDRLVQARQLLADTEKNYARAEQLVERLLNCVSKLEEGL